MYDVAIIQNDNYKHRLISFITFLSFLAVFFLSPISAKALNNNNCPTYAPGEFQQAVDNIKSYGIIPNDLEGDSFDNYTAYDYDDVAATCNGIAGCVDLYRKYLMERARFNHASFCFANQREVSPHWDGPYRESDRPQPLDFIANMGAAHISDWACDADLDGTNPDHPFSCVSQGITDQNDFWIRYHYDIHRMDFCRNGEWTRHVTQPTLWQAINLPTGNINETLICDCGNIGAAFVCLARDNSTFRVGGNRDSYHITTATSFRAELEGDKFCIYAYSAGLLPFFVDCRRIPAPPLAAPQPVACWVDQTCFNTAVANAAWKYPVTGIIVQCVQDTLSNVFEGSAVCNSVGNSLFDQVQDNVRNTVTIAITLYIILIGVKAALGQYGSQANFIESVIKLSLVIYFVLEDGWNDYYEGILGSMASLSTIMLNSATPTTGDIQYCNFDNFIYQPGYDYLRLWDVFDCKLYYYLGFEASDNNSVAVLGVPRLLLEGLINIWNFQILIVVFAIVAAFTLIGMAIYVVRTYITAIVAVTILIYLSPLFIPMVLFAPTKKFFDNWRDELMGYILYPVVLFGFVALLLSVFDQFFWGEAEVQQNMNGVQPMVSFALVDCTTNTTYSPTGADWPLGCRLHETSQPGPTRITIPIINISVWVSNWSFSIVIELIKITLFGILFVTFISKLDTFIAALVGTQRTSPALAQGNSAATGGLLGAKMAGKYAKLPLSLKGGAKSGKGGGTARAGGGGGASAAAKNPKVAAAMKGGGMLTGGSIGDKSAKRSGGSGSPSMSATRSGQGEYAKGQEGSNTTKRS